MNSYFKDILSKHDIHPLEYRKNNSAYIIKDRNNSFVIKPNVNNYDIYKYLLSRDFRYFPNYFNSKNDNYDLSQYIEDNSLKDEQKIGDMINILSLLHKKTSFKRETDLDEIKEIYENLKNDIMENSNYFQKLNDYIDTVTFYSPSEYLLVRNISLIYYMLNYSKNKLDEWYKNIKEERTIRNSLIHNNIDLDHLLINNGYYLVSWDHSSFSLPINDIYDFYRKYYRYSELNDILYSYESNNKLEDHEKDLLFIKLSLPQKISFTNDTYLDTKMVNEMLIYLNKIYKVIKKDHE